jgi:protein-ribulosamine 3-kinase
MCDAIAMRRYEAIAREIGQAGIRCHARPETRIGGGSIHECHRWQSDAGPLFVKVAARNDLPMFEGEAAGLRALASANAVRVPVVRAIGSTDDASFLALEWIDRRRVDERAEERLGERLAEQHRRTAPRFGFERDNHIGCTPQANGCMDDWAGFFKERRLRPQFELAMRNGFDFGSPGEQLLQATDILLDHRPEPSLLHGDLWGGNWFPDAHGEPTIYDPAVYHGDREADLAMTELFGGFGPTFYRAYEHAWPLPPGADIRRELYNLYHVLNHANLFGAGYAHQAHSMIGRLLAQVRG